MTHDELLKQVGYEVELAEMQYLQELLEPVKAIRAVVELHKPDESDFPDEWESCVECSGNGYVAMYPCQTIKVIEKALNG